MCTEFTFNLCLLEGDSMRELKLQLNIYSPRDYLRIQNHLNEMAEKGWMLEQIDRFFWRYRICEPKKLRFSVLFFQNRDWEKPYREQCEAAGWRFVSGFAGMQIFCTEDPNLPPVEIDPTPRWKAIHKATMTRDRILWFGLLALALLVLASTVLTAISDPIEVLADGPRLMYAVMMVACLLFVGGDVIHYYHWRQKARREYHKIGTLTEPAGNLIGFGIGLAVLATILVAILILEDPYGRIVTLLNIASIAVSLLFSSAYRLLKKRKSADAPVSPMISVAIALATFLLLGILQSALLANLDITSRPEDMKLTVQTLTVQEDEGACLIEEQNSLFLADLTGRNIVGEDESQKVLWYRITVVKTPKLIDFAHANCLPEHLQEKLESQDVLLWQSEGTWLHRSDNGMYTYYIYYEDRAATLLVNWELTEEQISVATQALINA